MRETEADAEAFSPEATSRRGVIALGAGLAGGALLASCTGASRRRGGGAHREGPAARDRRAELDELFGDLEDQRGRHRPIQPEERAARRARLARLLAERDLDALLCEGGATMAYLSGVSWGRSERTFALVVLADGAHFWVTPRFEAEKAKLRIEGEGGPGGELLTWQEHEYAWRPLAAHLGALGVERLALEPSVRFFIADNLARELGAGRVASGEELLVALRGRKDAHELELLRAANVLTQRAIAAAAEHARAGMTGAQFAELLHHAMRRLGLRDTWDLSLVGPAAAYPHGEDRARTIRRGDFLLVDTGGSLHGYQSDETRTWVVEGRPSEHQTRVWNAVRDAQQRAFDAIRPGVRCAEIDRAAREAIDRAGFGPGYRTFTHRLGHGIGMEGHEGPYLDGGSDVVLAEGMTFSDEPGIYLYGDLGVRLEDIVAVTPDGAEHFGDWQASPLSPA